MWYDENTGIAIFTLGGKKITVMSDRNSQCFCDEGIVSDCYKFHEPVFDQDLVSLILDWSEKPENVDDITYITSIVEEYGEYDNKYYDKNGGMYGDGRVKYVYSYHQSFKYHAIFNTAVEMLQQNIDDMFIEEVTTKDVMSIIDNLINERDTTSDAIIKCAINDALRCVRHKFYNAFHPHE